MSTQISDRVKKIKSGAFVKTDVVEIGARFEKLASKKYENDYTSLIRDEFLDEIEKTIKTGFMWKFNPTCLKLFIDSNTFEYNRNKLEEWIIENSTIRHQEVDRNSHLYSLYCEVEILLINSRELNEELLDNADFVSIQSLTGDIEI